MEALGGEDLSYVRGTSVTPRPQALIQELCLCKGSEAGSYLRLIDSCITQLKAQGPFRACNESKEEEEDVRIIREGRGHQENY